MSLCCNAHQIDVIVAVCAYTVLILGTWRVDAVVKPFKLLAVFVHVARCVKINCNALHAIDGVGLTGIFAHRRAATPAPASRPAAASTASR